MSLKTTIIQNYTSIVATDNMGKAIDHQMTSINLILEGKSSDGLTLFENSKEDFYRWYKKARESAYTQQEKILLDSINLEYNIFVTEVYTKIISNKNILTEKEKKEYLQQVIKSVIKINNRCYSIFDINHSFMEQIIQKVENITYTATIYMLLIISCGILLAFIFSSKFSDYLVKPLKNLTRSVELIAEGNFSDKVEIKSLDEIGDLAKEFNKMSEKLQKYELMNVNKLLYEKRKLEIIIESINEPVVMTDEKFNLLTINNSFRELFETRVVEDKNLREFIKVESILNEIQLSGDKRNPEIKNDIFDLIDISGNKKYFKVIHSSITIPGSEIQGYVFLFNDITKFQELDRMKTEFIGKVSHELKSPLTSIGLALGMFEDNVMGELNQQQKELILSMHVDYKRLSRLVREILDLTKIESGTLKLELVPVNVRTLIEDICKRFYVQSREKEIDLEVSLKDQKLSVLANYEYMFRAIENIISNAIKFTGKGGEISIIANKSGENIIIEIVDTGIGISPDKIDQIFDKFVQLHDDVPGSIGLGLSITREIVQLHNGEIFVKSNPGVGSSFIIKLKALE
ncbi:MAG: ATP-binding protein [Ignavibacteriaceae bacterium]